MRGREGREFREIAAGMEDRQRRYNKSITRAP